MAFLQHDCPSRYLYWLKHYHPYSQQVVSNNILVRFFKKNFLEQWTQIKDSLVHVRNFRLSYIRKVFSLLGKTEKIILTSLGVVLIFSILLSFNTLYLAVTIPIPGKGGSYSEGIIGQPNFINPIFASTEADQVLSTVIFSGLYHYDENGELVPDLASELPIISEDEKEYTVKLKDGITWHDGEKFTVEDVLFTIEAIQNPETKSPLQNQWLNTAVEKIDDHTIVFKNSDISGPFVHNLTLPIIQAKTWSQIAKSEISTSKNNLKPIGTGPFVLSEITQHTSSKIVKVTLKANKDYHLGRPNIEKLTFRFYDNEDGLVTALNSKEILGAGLSSQSADTVQKLLSESGYLHQTPLAQYQVLFFNLENSLLKDKTIRLALQKTFNKEDFIDKVLSGTALQIESPFINRELSAQTNQNNYNIEEAKSILENAGWKILPESGFRSKSGQIFQFTISTNEGVANVKAANYLAENWKSLGASVNVNVIPNKDFSNNVIRSRNFDALIFAQQLGADPDPFGFWHSSQIKDPGLNITGFNNQAADKLISQARNTTDNSVRKTKYQEFAGLLGSEIPAIFLNQSNYIYALNIDIKGLKSKILFDPVFRFSNIHKWYINESRKLK